MSPDCDQTLKAVGLCEREEPSVSRQWEKSSEVQQSFKRILIRCFDVVFSYEHLYNCKHWSNVFPIKYILNRFLFVIDDHEWEPLPHAELHPGPVMQKPSFLELKVSVSSLSAYRCVKAGRLNHCVLEQMLPWSQKSWICCFCQR